MRTAKKKITVQQEYINRYLTDSECLGNVSLGMMRPEGWVTPWATENHMNEALTVFWNLEHIPSCLGSWLAFPWTLETSFSTNFFPGYHHWQNYLLCWSSPPLGAVENMALGIKSKAINLSLKLTAHPFFFFFFCLCFFQTFYINI